MRPAPVEITERRPAIVPDAHPLQRYFAETRTYQVTGANQGHHVDVRVYRAGSDDHARLSIEMHRAFEAQVYLTPDALRRLASDLLDAAADIEAHPAEHLTRDALRAAITQAQAVPA